MARNRAQGYHRAFEKSFYRSLEAEQQARKRQKQEEEEQLQRLFHPTYVLYVGEKAVHTCHEWYEAHTVFLSLYDIQEWSWLPIHVTYNGAHIWGVDPQALAQDKREARRYKSNRTRYLNTCSLSHEEREASAQRKKEKKICQLCK
jgi:hypothetical protein